jgi:Uracil phosphoribosyltransferase
VLLEKGVEESKVLFLTLVSAPEGIHRICGRFRKLTLLTCEIDEGLGPDLQVLPGGWWPASAFTRSSFVLCPVHALMHLSGAHDTRTHGFAAQALVPLATGISDCSREIL